MGSFWSAEAYSSDRTDHFLPLIRLHAGSQTLLTLGVFKRAPNQPWLSILCQTDVLATHRFNQQEFCEKFPFVFLQTVNPNYCSFSMHAHMSESVLQELKKALKQTTVNLLRQPLIRNGNLLLHQKLI